MPAYDYQCKNCSKRFTLVMTIAEHESKRARCPKCKSTRAAQQLNEFFAQTSKKS
jgi:putative FmdB family regulatory protein